jgi:uncharacterized protein involved in outer membrane biogenesis
MVRKALAVMVAGALLLLVALFASLNSLVQKNRVAIEEKIRQSLGKSATFDTIQVDWRRGLAVAAKNLRIADDPRFAATPFIQSTDLLMIVRWLPLLLGRVEIRKFVLFEPEIQIIKNEGGSLNILNRKRPQTQSTGRFVLAAVEVRNGRVEYIDRSVEEPVEISIAKLDMELEDPDGRGRRWVTLAASLFHPEGQGQNVTLQGWVGTLAVNGDWTQTPMDVKVWIDSLLFGRLAQAVPFLGERTSDYLDVSGPIGLRTRIQGTLRQPRITDFSLNGPFFGFNKPNLKLTGEMDLSQGDSWTDGSVKGALVLDPVSLDRLKNLPFLKEVLPTSLVSDGPLQIVGSFEGKMADLRIQAHVQGKGAEIDYGNWLKKARGIPGSMDLTMIWNKDKTVFQNSTLNLHNLRLRFSGFLQAPPAGRLVFYLQSDGVELSGWDNLVPFLSPYQLRGSTQFNLSFERSLVAQESGPDIRGELDLNDIQVRDKKSRRTIKQIRGQFLFRGNEARMVNASWTVGASPMNAQGVVRDFAAPALRYSLRSGQLDLADLSGFAANLPSGSLGNFHSTGEIRLQDGGASMEGEFFSPQGTLQDVPYRDLKGALLWSPKLLDVPKVALGVFGGTVEGSAALRTIRDREFLYTFHPMAKDLDLKSLLSRLPFTGAPSLTGKLNLTAALSGSGTNWKTAWESLEGEGHAQALQGTVENFDLAQGVLSKVSGLPGIANLISTRAGAAKNPGTNSRDTPFDALEFSFSVAKERISTNDLLLETPDYDIRGSGWIGFDQTIRGEARMALSPQFSQQLTREHKNSRYLLDSERRLVIPFRIEGTLSRAQARPDLKRLAESIQRGLLRGAPDRARETTKQKRRPR